MAKPRRRKPEKESQKPAQPYDTAFKELKVYDPLWENHPKIKQMRTESREKGRAEGKLQIAQTILVNVVKLRFPALAGLAQEKAAQVDNPDVLAYLVEQVSTAPDENMVRWLLRPSAA